MLTPEGARAYIRRWEIVEEIEREENRKMSPEERLRKIDAAFQMAIQLGLEVTSKPDLEITRRWQILRERLR